MSPSHASLLSLLQRRPGVGALAALIAVVPVSIGFAAAPQRAASPSRRSPQTAQAASGAPSRFRITGIVVNSLTRTPVPKARITVSQMAGRRANRRFAPRASGETIEAIADPTGHFEVEVPSAGGWSVNAAARGYCTQAFDEHDGYSTAIVLTDASPVFDFTFPIPPASTIEGFVLDEAGEAVRNGRVTLSVIPAATPDDQHPKPRARNSKETDDRGYYKFTGLLPGDYEVSVQAQPWYATTAPGFDRFQNGGIQSGTAASEAAPDPLDVAYPNVWYPGVTDPRTATPLTLRRGETRVADFRLLPIPGFHLRVPSVAEPSKDGLAAGRTVQSGVYLSRILPDGTETGVPSPLNRSTEGEMDFAGLSPGTYIVHRQGEAGSGQVTSTVEIAADSARVIDLNQVNPMTKVTLKTDPPVETNSLGISFRDMDSGRVIFVQRPQEFRLRGGRRGSPTAEDSTESGSGGASFDRTVSLQPGRYEVFLNGGTDQHLTRIEVVGTSVSGTKATGRIVTVGTGSPTLLLHLASGRANVMGFVRFEGHPDAGAMVLLVPATLGDPAGINITRRDQSNSDGSFDLTSVLPGAYILVAIDHGWDVNWSDPATLRRFLQRGVPLDLSAPADVKQTVEAQSP